jgi:hypothetical protein
MAPLTYRVYIAGCNSQIDCKRGFSGSAFLVRDGNGFAHGKSLCGGVQMSTPRSVEYQETWSYRDVGAEWLYDIGAWVWASNFERVKNLDTETGKILRVPRDDDEVVVKGGRRDYSVYNSQGHSLLLCGGG